MNNYVTMLLPPSMRKAPARAGTDDANRIDVPRQPFYAAKDFWVAALNVLLLGGKLANVIPLEWDTTMIAATVLALLQGVFRWNDSQALALRGGVKLKRVV